VDGGCAEPTVESGGMRVSLRRLAIGAAAVLSLAGFPAVLTTIHPGSTANADVCASAGRRVTVSGCASLSDVMAPYVVPPDAYAPLTPNATACVGWNGRWVNASGCT
jgi:hypothetical protein